ncbi:hypothetical protein QQP08_006484 [Theobroma cacao]|nr:hypothetical protein QQP08_006484 [Theobroma cacao]
MVALIILGSDQLNNELYGKILEGLKWNTEWKNFIGSLKEDRGSTPVSATGPINKFLGGNRSSESTTGSSSAGHIEESGNENQIIFKFHEALQVTYKANWRRISDYISPVNPCKEEILRVLFPKAANLCGEVLPPASYDDGKSSKNGGTSLGVSKRIEVHPQFLQLALSINFPG